ncbi:aminotransferase class V-fold PLP-dependent enzyme [Croceitalea sp. MTPC9]|uniref:pyridoxal phosphate-dependent decarboxylase family protein n=1 Tax=unclassified Croceitalea TaxID=2632280 RepID=UPI002B370A42|nr:aminotransferase class V-fold PLP-dependent enzyme [Croceitalea sp. MTPC6]GMN16080.1 aminotransferase class V-fold PLP-dependent enzyme [Croceitalea sp. MTPC9]
MTDLQRQLFLQLEDRSLFNQAHGDALTYLDTILDRNVYPSEKALKNLSVFEEELPNETCNGMQVLEQLHRFGGPATTATLGGRYFGFVCGSALPIGLAAKNLATYWDQAPAMHVLSPIASKLESVVEKWLIDLFNLPDNTSAGFVSGTSTANLCALAAARYRILQKNNWDVNEKGLTNAPTIRIVTGRHTHSTVLKAVAILGLGKQNIEWVEVDNQGRIILDTLPKLDKNTILVLQAGNVNSGAFDNFESLCEMANNANTWVHIDGAFGLWANAVTELKYLTQGLHKASSWAVDGHKTLNTPYDCGIVLCRDQEAITSSLHMSGSYLIESQERDGMFYTPEMSRRARIIELWAILKNLGKSGIDEMILTMHHRAKQFAQEIGEVKGYFIENEVVFNQVIVRCETDEMTDTVLHEIQQLRECWLGGSVWFSKKVMRISICSWATTSKDITRSVASFKKALRKTMKKTVN